LTVELSGRRPEMGEPTALSLLAESAKRAHERIDEQDREIESLKEELAVVPVMKRAFYWVAVVLTGAIVAVIGSAVTIILTTGGGPR
jgi:hypothetical protein